MSYLEKLKSAGIEVRLSGTGGIEIGGQPSDQQQKWIQDHKPELLAELDPDSAKREAERLGILPGGSTQQIEYVRCMDCGFDRADGNRCMAGLQRTERDNRIRLCIHYSENPESLTPEQETAIRAWLDHIGERQNHEIAKTLAKCQGNADALAYFLKRASEIVGPCVGGEEIKEGDCYER